MLQSWVSGLERATPTSWNAAAASPALVVAVRASKRMLEAPGVELCHMSRPQLGALSPGQVASYS